MANKPNRNRALADTGQRDPETALELDDNGDPPPEPFDITSFDPNDYEWRPVVRRPRADGWTPEVQRTFIEALADTGLVSTACEAVDMSVQSAYRLRRAPGAEGFAHAWEAATAAAATRLIDVAFTRAIQGVDVPVFDRDGCRIGAKWQYNDRLLMFLLRAYRPDQFRHAQDDTRRPNEPAPAALPVDDALAALGPATPADPHRLMPPDRLADAVDIAHSMGELYEAHPDLDRERYVRPRIEANHPRANERARLRHKREYEKLRREDEEGEGE
ncbi:hypothetical protein M0208_12805 [Sphingomonas sp. SUN019]|uniref:hypothetical protein n=1 Tax=Sphingomonas sp. SUN019 TaxID=2937788 RepID=UPI0021644610|nr:hypothetical protein [Sphingomonas sp. SUN019]UVO51344.1 hypothetical protein M0208_12805 [Sphingomonas sp. SUN019]